MGIIFLKALGRERVFPQRPIAHYFLMQPCEATNKTTAKQARALMYSWVFFRVGYERQAC